MSTEQRPKVVRDLVLMYVVLHNMIGSHIGGADRPPSPADDIQPHRLTRWTTGPMNISETLPQKLSIKESY